MNLTKKDGYKIRLVSIDIEGCLTSGKIAKTDLQVIKRIRELNNNSRLTSTYPRLTLCSGRPQPFVEAMIRVLDGWTPAVCENGGVIYDPIKDVSVIHPNISEEQILELNELKKSLIKNLSSSYRFRIELGKETMISINPSSITNIETLYKKVKHHVHLFFPSFTVTRSKSAVDISPPKITKLEGIKMIATKLGIGLSEICAIGDSINDIEILKKVGFPASPSNAEDLVKKSVRYISSFEDGRGVIDIISKCIEINKDSKQTKT